MKKIVCFLLLVCCGFLANGQKENGTVYSEHEAIQKTKALWNALFKGDKETFLSFYADTVNIYVNGTTSQRAKNTLLSRIDYWAQFENLSISDDKPATPDAIQYSDGGLWVQDWLRLTGTHKATGINLDLPIHSIYGFDKNGKLKNLIQYYNDADFREIVKSAKTIENGKVYVNHPYIVTVRKLVNAWCAEDLDKLLSFYSSKALFFSLTRKYKDYRDLTAQTAIFKETFRDNSDIKLTQYGNPDCVYYDQGNSYIVYSWWNLSYTDKDGKKKSEIPVMLSHTFDKDGKVLYEMVDISTNMMQ